MDWLETLIVEIGLVGISSTVTGIIVWYLTTNLSEKRLQKHLEVSTSELAGRWEGIHLSRDDSRGGTIISRHTYDLTVSSSGKIKGIREEAGVTYPYKFAVDGAVRPGEIFLMERSKTTREPAYTWFYNLYNLEKLPGFHLTYDFDGRPYVAYLVLSRKRLDDNEYFDLLGRDLEKFYIHPMKKHS